MKLTEEVYLVGSGAAGVGLSHDLDCHVYLLDGGGELALVDAGVGLDVKGILRNIEAEGFRPEDVRYILITHAHGDHVGGAAALREATGAKVFMSEVEAPFIRDGDEDAMALTMARAAGYYPPDYHIRACPVDRELRHGDEFRVGSLKVRAIHLPGHSKGSMLYLVDGKRRYLFSGDAVFFGGVISLLNCVGSSLKDFRENIWKLKGLEVDALLPGHLSFCLKGGQKHLDAAVEAFKGLGVPTNLIGRHGLIMSQ